MIGVFGASLAWEVVSLLPLAPGTDELRLGAGDVDGDCDTDLVVAWGSVAVVETAGAGVRPLADGGALAVGDVDGDGLTDAVVLDGVFRVFRGGLVEDLSFDVGIPVARFLALVDVDGDRILDLLLVDQTAALVTIAGLGGGAFSTVAERLDAGVREVRTGDLDGDGATDVVFSDRDGWRRAAADNGTRLTDRGPLVVDAVDLAVADVDGDGALDLVSAGPQGLGWSRNAACTQEVVLAGDFVDVAAADVDDDGVLDLVVDTGAWVRGLGGGAFADATPLTPTGTLYSADLDGDGVAELLVGTVPTAADPAYRLVQVSADAAVPWVGLVPANSNVLVSDLDGDHAADLVVANGWHPARGGMLGLPEALPAVVDVVVDVDGDGTLDLVSVDPGTGDIEWMRGLGGTFADPVPAGSADLSQPFRVEAAAGDLDGDGDGDLVLAPLQGRPLVARWDGGTFDRVRFDGVAWRELTLLPPADVTGDGVPDVLALVDLVPCIAGFGVHCDPYLAPRIVVWPVDGEGIPGAPREFPTEVETAAMAAAFVDLDLDRRPDIVFGGDGLDWMRNLGGAEFAPPVRIREGTTFGVASGDFDLDGDDDLVVADDLWRLFLLPNDGGAVGTLEPLGSFGIGGSPIPADVDGDGDLDLLGAEGSRFVSLVNPTVDADPDGDGLRADLDCAPDDRTRGFGLPELADGEDNDCDGEVDEACAVPSVVPADTGGRGCGCDQRGPGAGFGVLAVLLLLVRPLRGPASVTWQKPDRSRRSTGEPVLAIEKLFCEELFRIHRRQMRLINDIDASVYVFHKDTGSLVFSDGTTFETQVLGLETPAKLWRWAWADEGSLAPELTVAAKKVREYGEGAGMSELTTGSLAVDHLRCAGHTMAAVASVVHRSNPYFRCAQPDGVALYVLLPLVTLEDDARALPRDEVRQGITDMFAAYAQVDDLLTLRSAMTTAGFEVESTDTQIIGRRGEDRPMVFERAWFD